MESMKARRSKKVEVPVGNHEPFWMSHVARIAESTGIWLSARDMMKTIRKDVGAGEAEWTKLERYLREQARQIIARLRDHSAPFQLRQMEDVNDWVNRPEMLSGNPNCWAYLGALEAITTILGSMHTARVIYSDDPRAAATYFMTSLNIYQGMVIKKYEEIRSFMVLLYEDAKPGSVELVIQLIDTHHVLMVKYDQLPGADVA